MPSNSRFSPKAGAVRTKKFFSLNTANKAITSNKIISKISYFVLKIMYCAGVVCGAYGVSKLVNADFTYGVRYLLIGLLVSLGSDYLLEKK